MLRRYRDRFADGIAARIADRLASTTYAPSVAAEPAPFTIALEYPVSPRVRYGYGQAAHPETERLLAAGDDEYRRVLESFVAYEPWLKAIPRQHEHGEVATAPAWINGWLPGLDSLAIYAFLAGRAPRRYVEVGSGNSTMFARRAIGDHGLRTEITSIDPEPRAGIDTICDHTIRLPLEEADLTVFTALEPGDVVFIDNSHRAFQNSDVTVFFLEVLPRLPPGVLVGIHDICLPYDYPPDWTERYYSEQYLLAAFLLGGHSGFRIVLPSFYCAVVRGLRTSLDGLWSAPEFEGVETHGAGFWLEAL